MPRRRKGFKEIWVTHGDRSLCALINGARGWLMFLRETGDAGFSSRNPEYDGPVDATIEYYLNNGQRDEFPASWAYPIAEVQRAIEYFQREGERPPFIKWHAE